MSLGTDLDGLIEKETNLTSQTAKVAKFGYTDLAYTEDDYEGVEEYDAGQEQNIPLANTTAMKVNTTVLTEGFQAQASSIGRRVINHFFGRCSYNLNKAHDNLLDFLNKIKNNLGVANGFATLRSDEARLTVSQSPYGTEIPVSSSDSRDLISYMKKLFTLPYLGRNWAKGTGGDTYGFQTVYYANGIWVAGSNRQGLWWSTDGKNWTQGTGGTTYTYNTVYYANGIWVAGGYYHSDGSDDSDDRYGYIGEGLWWSTDGKNWTQGTGGTTSGFLKVYYANGIWVASSYDIAELQGDGLWWSEDGKNWTQGTGGTTYAYTTVYYANGIWVAGNANGEGLWWSEDGKNWTQGTGGTTYIFYTVYYANGIWVAGSNRQGIWWSEDGKNWTQGTGGTTYAYTTVYYANGIWVAGNYTAGGQGAGLWWSEDGKTWTQCTGGTTNRFLVVYCANGIWVAGSYNGLWWSTDGKNWTQGTGGTTYTYNTVYYANGIWVAGSIRDLLQGGGLWWSSIDNLNDFPLLDL